MAHLIKSSVDKDGTWWVEFKEKEVEELLNKYKGSKTGIEQCTVPGDVMRSYILNEIESTKTSKNRYGWISKHFKRFYEGRINALENTIIFIDTAHY